MPQRPSMIPLLAGNRVVPVITIDRVDSAVPMARALARGGVSVIEVTLRTAEALEALAVVCAEVPDMVAGAGTILTQRQLDAALRAGAKFIVTPGTTRVLGAALAEVDVPVLPGVATVSEMMTAIEMGFSELKFFPAEAAGGAAFLRSIAGPLPDLRFCPTGGITPANAGTYLNLHSVLCVGGSWLTPPAMIAGGDYAGIERLARQASESFGAIPA